MTVHSAVLDAVTKRWHTSHDVQRHVFTLTGHWVSESAVTARIRDLRKPRYGSHTVTCKYMDNAKGKKVFQYGICE